MIAAGQPVAGSFAAGAAIAAVGAAFTGVAALTAQLSRTARGANGLATAVLAVAFLVGGVGNMLGGVDAGGTVAFSAWPAWLSPIGWGYQMRPFGGDHWWLLGLFAAFAGALVAVAGRLAVRRDLGAGAAPGAAGPRPRVRGLRGPFGLAWRLQRPAFFGWLAALVGFGLIFGSVSENAQTMGGSARRCTSARTAPARCSTPGSPSLIVMGGVAVAVYAVQVLLRMREEEARGRLEPVLSSAVGRPRWAMGFVLTAGSARPSSCGVRHRRGADGRTGAGRHLRSAAGPERRGAGGAARRARHRRGWSSRSSPCCRGGRRRWRGCCSGRPSC